MTGEALRDFLMQVIALIILALPLFLLPAMLKFSGGLLGRIYDRSRGIMHNNMGGKQVENIGNKLRGTAGDATKRGFRNTAAGIAAKGEQMYQHGGNKATRRVGQAATFVAGFPNRRNRKLGWQEENTKRMQDEAIFERLAEVDSEGNPTARAQAYATAAAGAGGAKNAERIRRLALEQNKKELMADVSRETSAMTSAGALETGAWYWETDSQGNLKRDAAGKAIGHDDHGRAMAAQARGEGYRVNKVGEARDETKGALIVGNSAAKKYAAMMRSTSIGDGAAISYMAYGDEAKGIKAVDDKDLSDFMQFATDSSSKAGNKLPHLLTKDQGLTGMVGSKMKDIHGSEFKAAASRIRQLREQGKTVEAQTIQDAWESAYETLATDDQLSEDFSQKHVDSMRDFNAIVSGTSMVNPRTGKTISGDRLVMREYGERFADNGGKDRITNTSGATSKLRVANPLIGNAATKGFK